MIRSAAWGRVAFETNDTIGGVSWRSGSRAPGFISFSVVDCAGRVAFLARKIWEIGFVGSEKFESAERRREMFTLTRNLSRTGSNSRAWVSISLRSPPTFILRRAQITWSLWNCRQDRAATHLRFQASKVNFVFLYFVPFVLNTRGTSCIRDITRLGVVAVTSEPRRRFSRVINMAVQASTRSRMFTTMQSWQHGFWNTFPVTSYRWVVWSFIW